MEVKCLIIDDEPAAIRVVESYLMNLENFKLIAKCKSTTEAFKALNENEIDLLFLDINMPGLSGLELLKSLREPPLAIITTAYREYAVESFELEVVDYLHKPFSFDRFFKAIQRVEEKLENRKFIMSGELKASQQTKEYLFIKSDKKHYRIRYDDLLFIESMGDYCKFITKDKTYLSYITLKKLLEILPSNFIRVHKSFIVQFDKVDMVEGNVIKIQQSEVPIGYSYRKDFIKYLDP
ncbi:MAG: response regulator transcription factor [Chlorobi bacterium]|nr:response regulator transcription factor [Chlorobiota bacterium]